MIAPGMGPWWPAAREGGIPSSEVPLAAVLAPSPPLGLEDGATRAAATLNLENIEPLPLVEHEDRIRVAAALNLKDIEPLPLVEHEDRMSPFRAGTAASVLSALDDEAHTACLATKNSVRMAGNGEKWMPAKSTLPPDLLRNISDLPPPDEHENVADYEFDVTIGGADPVGMNALHESTIAINCLHTADYVTGHRLASDGSSAPKLAGLATFPIKPSKVLSTGHGGAIQPPLQRSLGYKQRTAMPPIADLPPCNTRMSRLVMSPIMHLPSRKNTNKPHSVPPLPNPAPGLEKGEKRLLEIVERQHYRRGMKQRKVDRETGNASFALPFPVMAKAAAATAVVKSSVVTAKATVTAKRSIVAVAEKSSKDRGEQLAKEVVLLKPAKRRADSFVAALVSATRSNPQLWNQRAFAMVMTAAYERSPAKSSTTKNKTAVGTTAAAALTAAKAVATATATCLKVPATPKAPALEGAQPTCIRKGCKNIGRSEGLCLRHGGKKSKATCMREGCHSKVVNNGVCMKHGARRRICSTKGCTNMIVKGGVCVRHGAKQVQRICRWQGCSNVVVCGGVCVRHGANKL